MASISPITSSFHCYKHLDELLIDSEIWYRRGRRTEFKVVSLTEVGVKDSDELKFIEKNKVILKEITRESVKLANQRYDWDLENLHEVYRSMLNSGGYLSAKGTVNQNKIRGRFTQILWGRIIGIFEL